MEILNKTDRLINLLNDVLLRFSPRSITKIVRNKGIENHKIQLIIIEHVLSYKVLSNGYSVVNINSIDKDTLDKACELWPSLKEIEDEFISICPDPNSILDYLQILKVKYEDILNKIGKTIEDVNNETGFYKYIDDYLAIEGGAINLLYIEEIVDLLDVVHAEINNIFNRIERMAKPTQSEQYITDKSIDHEDIEKIKELCTDDVNECDIKLFLKHGSASKKLSSYNKKGVTAKKLCDCLLPIIDCGKFPQIKMQSTKKEKAIFISNNFDYGFDSLKNDVVAYYKLKEDN